MIKYMLWKERSKSIVMAMVLIEDKIMRKILVKEEDKPGWKAWEIGVEECE